MNYSISEKPFYKDSRETPQRYRCKCKKKTDWQNFVDKILEREHFL